MNNDKLKTITDIIQDKQTFNVITD